ncbi:unnamed protein product [Diabrotica balteata]|uniref:C2H2-type domain-containing protein n=1 Tax=Diabrotica balteata TaxID=107213 RepID=A0A9N9TCR7_DIABA|nr:unnamed protein product [Diabrotica balteata]
MRCDQCQQDFANKSNLFRHKRKSCKGLENISKKRKIDLPVLENLESSVKRLQKVTCDQCQRDFANKSTLVRHKQKSCRGLENISKRRKIDLPVLENLGDGVQKLQQAFQYRIATYRFRVEGNCIDPSQFMNDVKQKVSNVLSDYIRNHHSFKVSLELFGLYIIPAKEISEIKSFNTKNKVVTTSSDLNEIYDDFKDYSPLSASSYIRLPCSIEKKGSTLNIQNQDSACFAWTINAAIFPHDGNPTKPESYPHYNTLLSFDGIEFPVKLKDIHKFEQLNNISVNVFGLETYFKDGKMVTEVVGHFYHTPSRQATHVNLLLTTDDNGNSHYCLITNLSRLVRSQKTKRQNQTFICDGCLQFFRTQQHLTKHQECDCNHLRTEVPSTGLKINKYDATNLYGAAMSNYLPTGGFRWLETCDNFDCFAIADDSFKGYVLEVDLDYPPNLHNIHNDLPFCPEPIKTLNNQYTKLVPNLYDKKKIHADNVYNDIKNNISYFDTSNYPIDNINGIPKTQSVIGKMKDEFKGVPVESFIGTGAKAYCVKLSNSNLLKKAKGI